MPQPTPLAPGFGAIDLFQILRDGQPRTRSELTGLTGFARATLAARIDTLVSAGLILPVSDAVSTGGRPSSRVALNPNARLVAAADFGAAHATVAIMNLSGEILAIDHSPRSIADGPQTNLDWLAETIRRLLSETGRPSQDVMAIGLGLPGPVEHESGRPTNPPIMPGWNGYDVPGHLGAIFDVPVLVDNDVNIMALGERANGWPDVDDFIFIKMATGIGSGIVSGGQLQRGSTGSAGDIGHIPIARGAGVTCHCGNIGCLEAIAATPAIVLALNAEGIHATSSDDIVHLVESGNPAATRAVRQVGRDIGDVVNMMVSILNPSLIVVGGALAQAGEQLIAGMRETVYSRSMPLATSQLTIASTRVGPDAGVIGAGIMALDFALDPANDLLEKAIMRELA